MIDGLWHLFYYGFDGERAGDGVATCEGGSLVNWRKSPYNPILSHGPPGSYDSIHAHKPFVLEHNGIFYHFYCAVSESERTIALATSERGGVGCGASERPRPGDPHGLVRG
jgi:hypothetical protein